MPAVIDEQRHHAFNPNSLPRKVTRNATGLLFYRSDYELRGLRAVSRLRKALWRDFEASEDVWARIAIAKALDATLERERVLLRIPLPRSSDQEAPKNGRRAEPQRGLIVQEQPAQASTPIDVQSTTPVLPP